MSARHTPGPWWTDAKYNGREYGCAIIAARTDAGPLPGNPTRGMVAWASALLNTEARTCEANARLIAAAPAMLEALQKIRRVMHDGILNSDGKDVGDAINAMCAAIAKATGDVA